MSLTKANFWLLSASDRWRHDVRSKSCPCVPLVVVGVVVDVSSVFVDVGVVVTNVSGVFFDVFVVNDVGVFVDVVVFTKVVVDVASVFVVSPP